MRPFLLFSFSFSISSFYYSFFCFSFILGFAFCGEGRDGVAVAVWEGSPVARMNENSLLVG
jgi:hypothetical protein